MPKIKRDRDTMCAVMKAHAIILSRLKRIELSGAELSREQGVAHPVTVQSFLYSGRDTSASVLCELLSILGLSIVPSEWIEKLPEEDRNQIKAELGGADPSLWVPTQIRERAVMARGGSSPRAKRSEGITIEPKPVKRRSKRRDG